MKLVSPYALLLFIVCSFNLHAQDSSRTVTIDTSAASDAMAAQFLSRLNQVYITLNRINYTTGSKLNVQDIEKELTEVSVNRRGLKENLASEDRTLTIRTLQMYEILIVEMLGDLEEWRTDLLDHESKVRSMT